MGSLTKRFEDRLIRQHEVSEEEKEAEREKAARYARNPKLWYHDLYKPGKKVKVGTVMYVVGPNGNFLRTNTT